MVLDLQRRVDGPASQSPTADSSTSAHRAQQSQGLDSAPSLSLSTSSTSSGVPPSRMEYLETSPHASLASRCNVGQVVDHLERLFMSQGPYVSVIHKRLITGSTFSANQMI